jgi:hypothetical protein
MPGDDIGERWRHVLLHAMQAETLEGAAKSVCHLPVAVNVEFAPGDGLRLQQFTLDGQHGDSARDLALSLAQTIGAAKIGRDLVKNVLEPPGHLRAAVLGARVEPRRLAVCHAGALLGR